MKPKKLEFIWKQWKRGKFFLEDTKILLKLSRFVTPLNKPKDCQKSPIPLQIKTHKEATQSKNATLKMWFSFCVESHTNIPSLWATSGFNWSFGHPGKFHSDREAHSNVLLIKCPNGVEIRKNHADESEFWRKNSEITDFWLKGMPNSFATRTKTIPLSYIRKDDFLVFIRFYKVSRQSLHIFMLFAYSSLSRGIVEKIIQTTFYSVSGRILEISSLQLPISNNLFYKIRFKPLIGLYSHVKYAIYRFLWVQSQMIRPTKILSFPLLF